MTRFLHTFFLCLISTHAFASSTTAEIMKAYKPEPSLSAGRVYTCVASRNNGKPEKITLRITLNEDDVMTFVYKGKTFFQKGRFDKSGKGQNGTDFEMKGFSDSKNELGSTLINLGRYIPNGMDKPIVMIDIAELDKDLPAKRGLCSSTEL